MTVTFFFLDAFRLKKTAAVLLQRAIKTYNDNAGMSQELKQDIYTNLH